MKKTLVILAALLLFEVTGYAANGDLVVQGNLTAAGTVSATTVSAPNLLWKYYDSDELTITSGGSIQLAHGLGTTPVLVQLWLKCITAEWGYSVGDMLAVTHHGDYGGTPTGYGVSLVADSTNIKIKFGNSSVVFPAVNRSTGGSINLTNANWKVIVRVWAM